MGKDKSSNKFKMACINSKSLGKQVQSKLSNVQKWAQKRLESIRGVKFKDKHKNDSCEMQNNGNNEIENKFIFFPEDDSLDEFFNDLKSVYELDVNNKYQHKARKQDSNENNRPNREVQINQTISFATLFNNLDLFSQETQSIRTYMHSEADTINEMDEHGFEVNFSVEFEDAITLPGMTTRF